MRNKFFTIIVSLVLATLLATFSVAAFTQVFAQDSGTVTTQNSEVPRTISVSGTGKVLITPDIAYVTIGVHTENKDAAKAVVDNNLQAKEVTDAMIKMGVEAKDIQTTNFSIYPQQQYDQQGRPSGEITYIVDNTIYVTVRDLAKIGEILDAAVRAGANNVNGIQFDVADRSKALSEARKLAVADAKLQAEEFTKAAGVDLGAVQTINSYGNQPPIAVYEKVGIGGGAAMDAAPSVPISTGQMIIQVDVNMVYQIR